MAALNNYENLSLMLRRLGIDLSPTNKRLVEPTEFYDEVAVGSHIARPSHKSLLGPWHHGIFVGNKTVIHMFGETVREACIQLCSVSEFVKGCNKIAVVLYDDDDDVHRKATVHVAYMLAEDADGPRIMINQMYNIGNFNCEHFAVLCRTGLGRYDLGVQSIFNMLHDAVPEVVYFGKFGSPK